MTAFDKAWRITKMDNPYPGLTGDALKRAVAEDSVGADMQLVFSNHSGVESEEAMRMFNENVERLFLEMKTDNWPDEKVLSLVADMHR